MQAERFGGETCGPGAAVARPLGAVKCGCTKCASVQCCLCDKASPTRATPNRCLLCGETRQELRASLPFLSNVASQAAIAAPIAGYRRLSRLSMTCDSPQTTRTRAVTCQKDQEEAVCAAVASPADRLKSRNACDRVARLGPRRCKAFAAPGETQVAVLNGRDLGARAKVLASRRAGPRRCHWARQNLMANYCLAWPDPPKTQRENVLVII